MTGKGPKQLAGHVDRLAKARVGVVGDLVADLYISGLTDRISREAPVPVVRFEKQWLVAGGGANVALNISSVDAEVHVVGLTGEDAAGRELPAHLDLGNQVLAKTLVSIVIDDAGATYPLTIDPLLTSLAAKLTASDGAVDDNFGDAVAVDGDIIVVGASYDDDNGPSTGSAYIFERDAGGTDNWGRRPRSPPPTGSQATGSASPWT